MSSDWQELKWGDLITLEYGKSLKGYKEGEGEYQVFGTNGTIGWTDKYLKEGPSIIIGRKGAYRGVHYSQNPFFVIDTAFYVEPQKEFDMLWAYYQMLTIDIDGMDSGSAIPSTSRDEFYQVPVRVPPLDEQKEIANHLKSIDQKIHLNHQTNETLEAMAQAIFKSWFVDFDPVRAKIDAKSASRDPNRVAMAAISGISLEMDWNEVESELDQKLSRMLEEQRDQLARIVQLFPDELEESEIGEVPKGWGLLTLEDYITLSYGKSLRKKDRKDGSIPVYGSGGLTGTHDESLIDGSGIIVGRKGTVGSIYWEDKDFWPIDTVFYVEPKNEVDLSFYYYLLNTLGLDDMNTDAAVPGLNRNNAYRLKIPTFPADLMKSFANFTSDIHSMVFSKKEETKTLENLRDTLLPKLISGEINLN